GEEGEAHGLLGRLEVRGKKGKDDFVEALLADQLLGKQRGKIFVRRFDRRVAEERCGLPRGRARRRGRSDGHHPRRGRRAARPRAARAARPAAAVSPPAWRWE